MRSATNFLPVVKEEFCLYFLSSAEERKKLREFIQWFNVARLEVGNCSKYVTKVASTKGLK